MVNSRSSGQQLDVGWRPGSLEGGFWNSSASLSLQASLWAHPLWHPVLSQRPSPGAQCHSRVKVHIKKPGTCALPGTLGCISVLGGT